MPRLYNRTTEGDESRPDPLSGGREDVGNDRRTRGAGQQHSSKSFLICHPAKHADRVVDGVALIPESQATCLFPRKDKPLQHASELEAGAVEVIKDGVEVGLVWCRGVTRSVAWPLQEVNTTE